MWLGNDATQMQQMTFTAGLRPDRAVLRIEGPDAAHFLHNLLTADIEALGSGAATYAALLTPQGKILFDLFVVAEGAGYLVDCSVAQKAELVKRLTFYKLRAKVTITDLAGMCIGVSPEARPGAYRDPRCSAMGWRFIADAGSLPIAEDYEAARIAAGLADSDADLGSGEFFAHEANLDQLGAVNFRKGCYVGQEVVSRMEHRGLARNRILPLLLSGPAPVRGTEIRAGGKLVGTLLSSSGNRALGLIRLDRLGESGMPLLTGPVSAEVLKPQWARYDVPWARDDE